VQEPEVGQHLGRGGSRKVQAHVAVEGAQVERSAEGFAVRGVRTGGEYRRPIEIRLAGDVGGHDRGGAGHGHFHDRVAHDFQLSHTEQARHIVGHAIFEHEGVGGTAGNRPVVDEEAADGHTQAGRRQFHGLAGLRFRGGFAARDLGMG